MDEELHQRLDDLEEQIDRIIYLLRTAAPDPPLQINPPCTCPSDFCYAHPRVFRVIT